MWDRSVVGASKGEVGKVGGRWSNALRHIVNAGEGERTRMERYV